ncbi:uncharacterized protein EI97DRAFT_29026 [Westerdykella ornata]|uniref:Uncharacterized protein n=1 Tax=Westerdykella ornata TaxID=318751 RepID=A0A6A6JYZ2_WESOR|nr:uncharacterized protein EI97DRAFT_29026 [Westerdykella ornata]KAF2281425.1 hypothetical protein EI97DRAFT_29026 [Westerdykella ornata]
MGAQNTDTLQHVSLHSLLSAIAGILWLAEQYLGGLSKLARKPSVTKPKPKLVPLLSHHSPSSLLPLRFFTHSSNPTLPLPPSLPLSLPPILLAPRAAHSTLAFYSPLVGAALVPESPGSGLLVACSRLPWLTRARRTWQSPNHPAVSRFPAPSSARHSRHFPPPLIDHSFPQSIRRTHPTHASLFFVAVSMSPAL